MDETEMTYRGALNASRDVVRAVALEMKERADRAITQDAAMRFYARATFWATLALSAPDGDVKEVDVPATETRTFAFEDRVYDLSREYVDKDGDVWKFTGDVSECGVPTMKTPDLSVSRSLTHVVSEWGPLWLWSDDETDTSQHTQCHTCGYMHVPTSQ